MSKNNKKKVASGQLHKLGQRVSWLEEKAAGAEDLVAKIIGLKEASRDLDIKAELKSQQQAELADYSEEAALRCAQELKTFREELKKIDDQLRFLPATEVMAKNQHYSLRLELEASERKWRELQRRLEAAFTKEKKAKEEAAEIEEKNKELARQQELAAKKKTLLAKVEMSRGIVAGPTGKNNSAINSRENN